MRETLSILNTSNNPGYVTTVFTNKNSTTSHWLIPSDSGKSWQCVICDSCPKQILLWLLWFMKISVYTKHLPCFFNEIIRFLKGFDHSEPHQKNWFPIEDELSAGPHGQATCQMLLWWSSKVERKIVHMFPTTNRIELVNHCLTTKYGVYMSVYILDSQWFTDFKNQIHPNTT
jgi:hypothetical protein